MNLLKNKKIQFISTLTIVALALVLSSCTKDNSLKPAEQGGSAPGFTLESVSGGSVSLSDYSGKVVVLFFFGNTCPSCKASAPDIESKLHSPFKNNADYQILGIDQWNGSKASVDGFKTATGVTFPLLLNGANVAKEYNTTYDRLVVIDKQGNIAYKGITNAAGDVDYVKQKVDMLLAK